MPELELPFDLSVLSNVLFWCTCIESLPLSYGSSIDEIGPLVFFLGCFLTGELSVNSIDWLTSGLGIGISEASMGGLSRFSSGVVVGYSTIFL